MKIGYQLLSVYKDAAADLKGVLTKIAGLGYEGVEFIGLFGHDAREVRAMLDELGLTAVGNMMPIDSVLADPYRTVSDCRILGCEYASLLVMDPEKVPGGAKFSATLRDLRMLAELFRGAGIQLMYHHHSIEFSPFSGQTGMDFILDAMPVGALWPEIDCYWVQYCGIDPAEYIRQNAGRCGIIHLKDHAGYREGAVRTPGTEDDTTPYEFTPLGMGWQDIPAQAKAAGASGCRWLVVEQEIPSPKRSQYEAAKLSLDYLAALLRRE